MRSQDYYFEQALRLCAEHSMERIRMIDEQSVFEVLDLLQESLDSIDAKFKPPVEFDGEYFDEYFEYNHVVENFYECLSYNHGRGDFHAYLADNHGVVGLLKDEYKDRYKHAISMFRKELRIVYEPQFPLEICNYTFSFEEYSGWKKCLVQQQEDLMRVHVLAVGLVHDIMPAVVYLIRGKGSMDYHHLLELFHQAKNRPRDSKVLWERIKHTRKWSRNRKIVQVVFSWLQTEMDLFKRDDFSSNFAVFRPELEVEMTSILDHYVGKRSCAKKSCTFCLHLSPVWVEMSSPKGDSRIRNDIRTRLVCAFRYFFYEQFQFVLRQFENHQEQS